MVYEKEIFLIRHGQTDHNLKGMVQGSGVDAPLNATGRKQALAFYRHYSEENFDKIYTSRLQRAWQTVQVFEQDGIPIERHEGLNEICWGVYEGRQMGFNSKEIYNRMLQSWKEGNTAHRIEGGESPEDVAERQKPVLDLILSREEEKKILVCMHGRAMRIFICQLLGLPIVAMEDFSHHNLGLYHIKMTVPERYEILKENCIAHLGGI